MVAAVLVAFVVLDQWLDAFGPLVFSHEHWLGTMFSVVLFLTGLLLVVGFAAVRVDWHDAPELTAGLAATVLLGVLLAVHEVVTDRAFSERGKVIECEVVDAEKRVEWVSGPAATVTRNTYYDHRLDCAAPLGRVMITDDDRAGGPGQRVKVEYDPVGRLDPRFAGDGWDPGLLLLLSGAGLVLAVGLWSFVESRARRRLPVEPDAEDPDCSDGPAPAGR